MDRECVWERDSHTQSSCFPSTSKEVFISKTHFLDIRNRYLSREHKSYSQQAVSPDAVFIVAIWDPESWTKPVASVQLHSAGWPGKLRSNLVYLQLFIYLNLKQDSEFPKQNVTQFCVYSCDSSHRSRSTGNQVPPFCGTQVHDASRVIKSRSCLLRVTD